MDSVEKERPPIVLSQRERITRRLARLGIPLGHFSELGQRTRSLVNTNGVFLHDVVSAILPSDSDLTETKHFLSRLFSESSLWLQWLMFGVDPKSFLTELSQKSAGQRRVCGAVWGRGDLAYRCRTCEHDPTCAICVTCFQNGNHEGHDYSIIYTGGGCCDCGDITAWKRDGFCSNHRGTDHAQILPKEIADYAGPVLHALLVCWKEKLLPASNSDSDGDKTTETCANELSSMIVKMLLKFCDCCEGLLNFVSARILGVEGLLELLVKTELFLLRIVVEKLHELLLKLIGEPLFKQEFAKAFVRYYPVPIKKATMENHSPALDNHPLLSSFSVQIFTVPSLTLQLVLEDNLLAVLFECLWDIFQSCADEDGFIQAQMLAKIFNSTVHVVGEIRYVMSHDEVIKYVVCERPDIIDYWFRILGMLQGVNPHKRITGILHGDENVFEALQTPFILGLSIWNIQKHLVDGAFSVDKDGENLSSSPSSSSSDIDIAGNAEIQRHAKVGRMSHERTVVNTRSKSGVSPIISPCVKNLIMKCMKSLDAFLAAEACKHNWLDFSANPNSSVSSLRFKFFRTRKQASTQRARRSPSLVISSQGSKMQQSMFDRRLEDSADACPEALSVLSMTEWQHVNFDVGLQEISFHIPLHRLLGSLLHEGMKRCFGSECSFVGNPDDYFKQVLGVFHPYGFSSFVMEHPLRLRVFCAQVRAGMWRRNIDAGVLLSEFYHDIRLFDIGVEADLFLLQCCAALAPPEMFVKRIMERFGLLDYLSLDTTKDNEYESVLLQEMLTLLIQIITQRRFCGLSTGENLRREIIHKLATGDATRSQLVEALPRDLSEDPLVQDVIDLVANYLTPSGLEQGRYSLKGPHWKELDLYDPGWRPRDLQVAEERFFRFCKSSASYSQLPHWTHIFSPLFPLARIATSKAILEIIRAVLFYAIFAAPSSRRAPDGILLKSLHLLSLSLEVCEKCQWAMSPIVESSRSFPILSYANEKVKAENQSLLSLLVSLMWKHKDEGNQNPGESKTCSISSFIGSLLKKMAQLDTDCMDELQRLVPEVVFDRREKDSENKSQRSASDIDRKAKARERQAAILEKMKAQQSKFIASLEPSENESERQTSDQDLVQEESTPICSLCRATDSQSPLCFLVHLQKSKLSSFVDRGPPSWDGSGVNNGEPHAGQGKPRHGFMVGSREHPLDSPSSLLQMIRRTAHELMDHIWATENPTFFSSMEDSPSDVFRNSTLILKLEEEMYLSTLIDTEDMERDMNFLRVGDESAIPSSSSDISSNSLSRKKKFQRFGPTDCDGIYISSCGHAVHRECHDLYLSSMRRRHDRSLLFEGVNIVDPEMGELLCPVCRRLANSILQLPQHKYYHTASSKADIATPRLLRAISLLSSAAKTASRAMGPISRERFDKTTEFTVDPIIRKLRGMYQPNSTLLLQASSDHLGCSLILWDTLKYLLTATEIACRGRTAEKPDGLPSGLEALYGELQSSNGFVLSLLLQVAQASRSSNHLQALVRFCGLKLMQGSILPHSRQGFSSIDHEEESIQDIKFLKQVSDPILAHDPFSSLMWAVFCLPRPFTSSADCFTALVHLFYVVCVIQSTITCQNNQEDFRLLETGDPCLSMRGSELAKRFFVSRHLDSLSSPTKMIRKLTFPYLRKCALLEKMLTLSTPTVPCYNKSSPLITHVSGPDELEEITELESRFQIPSLEELLCDPVVRSLSHQWCAHFLDAGADDVDYVLYSTPAVPFQLMRLPRLYQDLLQRYVKQRCSDCNNIMESPALCLLCGKLCSSGGKQCCRTSKWQNHAAVCGAGIGVFLLILKTNILLQRTSRLASWPSLYLDAFGEEDQGMHRGKPLYLSDERYSALSYLVATHGFDRSSSVLRFTTITQLID